METKKLKLLIVANNLNWQSFPGKIKSLREWFLPKIDLKIDIVHTKIKNIPFTKYGSEDTIQNRLNNLKGIDPLFYDKVFSPIGQKYDIMLVVLPVSQWPSDTFARGWRSDSKFDGKQGAIELHIACDENEKLIWFGKDDGDMFFQLARHEILHALYLITKQKDNVHYWWNQDPRFLSNCLDEIDFNPQLTLLEKLLELYKQLLSTLISSKPMNPSEQLVKIATDEKHKDIDITDDLRVPDEVSCAFALTTILHEQDSRVPVIYGTKELDEYLSNSPLFKKIGQPIEKMKAGYIVNSPTNTNSRPDLMPNGHCGLYISETEIMSNSSETGLWCQNYTRESWRKRFGERGGFPIRIYQKVL
jgi:hypothetical protein